MYQSFEKAHLMTNFLETPCAFLEVIALFLQYRAIWVGRNKHYKHGIMTPAPRAQQLHRRHRLL